MSLPVPGPTPLCLAPSPNSPRAPVAAARTSLSTWYRSLWSMGRIFSSTWGWG